MSNICRWFLSAALLATAGCATEAPVQVSPVVSSKVLRMNGNARYASQDEDSRHVQSWEPIHSGDILPSGALIQTASEAWLDLSLGSPPSKAARKRSGRSGRWVQGVRVYQNTTVKIDMTKKPSDVEGDFVERVILDLRAGSINIQLAAISDESRYEVRFPRGTARLGEGLYTVQATGRVIVDKGRAFVTRKDTGDTKELNSGQQLDPVTGRTTVIGRDSK